MTAPLRVQVGVLTFRRPDELKLLVPELLAQIGEVNTAGRYRVALLVVDNDASGSARAALTEFAGVRMVVEPRPGIPSARNRVLDESVEADLLVFIDDDERPRAHWLSHLLDAHRVGEPAGVAGPVVSHFDGPVDPWISAGGFFARAHRVDLRTGAAITAAATNNLLLDLRQVRRLELRFAEDLGYCAGEDNLFTRALVGRGGRLVWCAEAVVDEPVPTARATRRWVLLRSFSAGNATCRVDTRLAGSLPRRLLVRGRAAASGLARVVGGTARWARGLVRGSLVDRARGLRTAARGAGMLSGACGYGYPAYRPPTRPPRPTVQVTR